LISVNTAIIALHGTGDSVHRNVYVMSPTWYQNLDEEFFRFPVYCTWNLFALTISFLLSGFVTWMK